MTLFISALLPVLIAAGSFIFFGASVTKKEFLLQVGISLLFLAIGWQVAKMASMSATEHLNGRITQKVHGTQKCCHCTTVCDSRDKKGNCTSSHESCPHFHDHYWDLETTVGTIGVDRCDGWGSEPAAWSSAYVGEPASVDHSYTNYLYADEDSLLRHAPMSSFPNLPEYPNVHGYYKVDHVVGDVVPSNWAMTMREMNADLGSSNQVDITIVTTHNADPRFAQALEAKWMYGPKNSLNIVMGIQGDTIQWVRVITLSKVSELSVELRDSLEGLKVADPQVMAIVRQKVGSKFKRTKMAEFEYLAANAYPRGWSLAVLIILQILVSIGVAYWSITKDIFGDETRTNYFKGYYT